MYKPPFQITPQILSLSSQIQEILGELKSTALVRPSIKLRKENKIRTIHHSLAIEGNTLTEDQITAILDNKKVIGPNKQIHEVLNALELYDMMSTLEPTREKDLLKAHAYLMKGLIHDEGKYRTKNVGILKGKKISHVAPQAKMVPSLMKNLFEFLKAKNEIPYLIKACIFHYELEFIHPFEDGNGRMGRFWQQIILMNHSPIFEYISVESLIHKEQKRYYRVLEICDKAGHSTAFIEFSLSLILKTLIDFKSQFRPAKVNGSDRMEIAQNFFGTKPFSRKEYLNLHKDISTATASRDLAFGVEEGILNKEGDKALASYRFGS